MGSAELLDTMATVSSASEARFGDVPDETLFTFSFCCQYLHAVFALFTLKHDHNRHWAPEEKLPSLSVRDKLLSTATTGFKSNTADTAG